MYKMGERLTYLKRSDDVLSSKRNEATLTLWPHVHKLKIAPGGFLLENALIESMICSLLNVLSGCPIHFQIRRSLHV